ncbi:hypothetical protein [Parageobacillus toebii]|jgi:hypothetical protein|uniref:hypothetical protein n=1 Tax=Parageobacillus toebii TaxID=153151 RepID=UPI002E21EB93|nr:hypothetical protein [Parageobacillus toebii]
MKRKNDLSKKLYEQFQRKAIYLYDQALELLENDGHTRKRANEYAKKHPNTTGYIIFGKEKGQKPSEWTGGKFYRIENGKAEPASAFQMFLEVEHGILDWWNY